MRLPFQLVLPPRQEIVLKSTTYIVGLDLRDLPVVASKAQQDTEIAKAQCEAGTLTVHWLAVYLNPRRQKTVMR